MIIKEIRKVLNKEETMNKMEKAFEELLLSKFKDVVVFETQVAIVTCENKSVKKFKLLPMPQHTGLKENEKVRVFVMRIT